MLSLLGTAITTSFFDSLNPSAIAQQMLIQAMVKKKRDVWFFILGISLANILLGLGIYYGIVAVISNLITRLFEAYPVYAYSAEILLGIFCLILGSILIFRTVRTTSKTEDTEVRKPASLTPLSLFIMGAAFCGVELTSALPYFGFLAVLDSHNPVFPLVLAFIVLYTFIYALPLILIYFGYNRLQGTVAIKKLELILGRISAYIIPAAVCIIGAYMTYAGSTFLLNEM